MIKKERMKKIAQGALISLIELDFTTDLHYFEYNSIEDYCKRILEATRDEIEEILGMNFEEIRTVEYWLEKKQNVTKMILTN